MAEPVNLGKEKEMFHEIPSPRSSAGAMERYGGPSLDDIRNILRDPSTQLHHSSKGKNSRESITFKVELRRTPGQSAPLPIKKSTQTTVRQDRSIVEALGKFGDGFFGGFKGLQEKHSAIVERKAREVKNYIDSRRGRHGDKAGKADNAVEAEGESEADAAAVEKA
jgi:hypothetical protein